MRAPLDLPSPGMGANNSFKPNLFRSSKSVAEKACHAFASTTQVGLIQALGLQENMAYRDVVTTTGDISWSK
jgi:hypothetical protein